MAPATASVADPKPDATIKNRTIEASVFVSDGIKANSALAADCLAEGKKWIAKQAADAASYRKTDPQMFRDGAWNYERKHDIRSVVADRYVSILRSDGAVALAPSTELAKSSGLTFHYPPYAVGPYAEGEHVAFVPWETLKPYLSPEGASIFAGVRPKADDDGSQ